MSDPNEPIPDTDRCPCGRTIAECAAAGVEAAQRIGTVHAD